jgi:glycosyltransferase involved in cell wall biosynthesis
MELPEGYSVHHIGINSGLTHQMISYFNYLGLGKRYAYEGKIPSNQVAGWLSDKQCLLSTSIVEGNPNSIIEGMACGIKPIVHGWPGSLDQFPRENVFRKVPEAVEMIMDQSSYHPEAYREFVKEHYSLANFDRIPTVIDEVMSEN